MFVVLMLAIASHAARAAHPTLVENLRGEGPNIAAMAVFAGLIEMRSPKQVIDAWNYQRDVLHFPIEAVFLELEHTGPDGTEAENFITQASLNGYSVFVRVREGDRPRIKGFIEQGAVGVIVPLVTTTEQIKTAWSATFYSGPPPARDVGFTADTGYLAGRLTLADLFEVDRRKILALMIERGVAVEKIEELAAYTATLCDRYDIHRKQVVFWWGPYDRTADVSRQALEGWRDAGPITDYDVAQAFEEAEKTTDNDVLKVSAVIRSYGFSLGGHTMTLQKAVDWSKHRGFNIFTFSGIQTSLMGGPSVREMLAQPMAAFYLNQLSRRARPDDEVMAEVINRQIERLTSEGWCVPAVLAAASKLQAKTN